MRSLIRQDRRHSRFRTISEGNDNNANATWGLSDREFLLDGGKGDSDNSLQDNMTFMRDIWIAIRSSLKAGLLVGSSCGILALAVVLLQTHDHGNPMRSSSSVIDRDWRGSLHGWQGQQPPLSSVSVAPPRPIPTAQQQVTMRDVYMHASVTLLPSEKEDSKEGMKKNKAMTTVVLQGSQKAGDAGHVNLPLSFYEGIHFGVSAWNPWGNTSSVSENTKRNFELRKAIEDTLTSHSSVVYNATWKWDSNVWEGFVLYCNSMSSGKQQQKEQISYNKEEFTTVQEDDACSGVESQVMDLARSYQQFVVYKWFSHVWGSSSGGINDVTRPHHHTSIIQNVIPTRTGLSLLRTKTVVYEAVTGTTVKEL